MTKINRLTWNSQTLLISLNGIICRPSYTKENRQLLFISEGNPTIWLIEFLYNKLNNNWLSMCILFLFTDMINCREHKQKTLIVAHSKLTMNWLNMGFLAYLMYEFSVHWKYEQKWIWFSLWNLSQFVIRSMHCTVSFCSSNWGTRIRAYSWMPPESHDWSRRKSMDSALNWSNRSRKVSPPIRPSTRTELRTMM